MLCLNQSQLLLDIGQLSERQTDHALEILYKANSELPEGDIWEPHHSPFVRELIELFTRRGLMRIGAVQAELPLWLAHEQHQAGGYRRPRPGMMARWSETDLALVRLYLESLPPHQFTLDDWLMVVDYLFQRYLPENHQIAEADWLATRAVLMGRVQANWAATEGRARAVLAALPNTAAEAARSFDMPAVQAEIMKFGRAKAAENIVQLTDGMRHRIRRVLIDHQEAIGLGNRAGDLQRKLLDEFGSWNRDWRRIAVTETGTMANEGFIAAQKPGARVRRVEMYRGACAFCRKIDGTELTVVSPGKVPLNGATEVWLGKTNIGRSASPRKRAGGVLIERDPHELWWIPAGTVHPHCRGTWLALSAPQPGDDPDFAAWLKQTLRKP